MQYTSEQWKAKIDGLNEGRTGVLALRDASKKGSKEWKALDMALTGIDNQIGAVLVAWSFQLSQQTVVVG